MPRLFCLTAAVDALDDVSRESEDHGAPDAYCASPDGTVQPGTALPDMPSPRSSTPPSDDLRRRFQLDERSDAPTHTSDDQDAWLDRSWGTAQAPAVSAPAQPASEPPPQKKEKKKKKRRTPRPTGGQAKEDLEASPLAYLAECAADEQALYEDSGGEESA